ncbi:MAG: hypothetical protein HY904_12795 [Deltaproteobacteria bacterium]|nr:hypothetical protein [Deltaproteobacteria bacterium]
MDAISDGLKAIGRYFSEEEAVSRSLADATRAPAPADGKAAVLERPGRKAAAKGAPGNAAPAKVVPAPSRADVHRLRKLGPYSTVDLNHLARPTMKALVEAGIGLHELRRLAGPDGLLRASEYDGLFKLLQRAPGPQGQAVVMALEHEIDANHARLGARAPGGNQVHAPLADLAVANAAAVAEAERKPVAVAVARRDQADFAETWNAHLPAAREALTSQIAAMQQQLALVSGRDAKALNQKIGGAQNKLRDLKPLDPATACFATATAMVDDANGETGPRLAGPYSAIQVADEEDDDGRVLVNPLQAQIGRNYIDTCLDRGRPVLVGVSYKDREQQRANRAQGKAPGGEANRDRVTDHFVVVKGRDYDADGKVFYRFNDPGDGGERRFYVDGDNGELFERRDPPAPRSHQGAVRDRIPERAAGRRQYQVSQVRVYQDDQG